MLYPFSALLARMKYITRWSLMHSTRAESLSEHTCDTALLAHLLCLIAQKYTGTPCRPETVAVAALYHDAPEIITGDMPTPVKYHSPALRDAYKALERESVRSMAALLPEELAAALVPCMDGTALTPEEHRLLKAADRLSALIKCTEEQRSGNHEFDAALAQQRAALEGLPAPKEPNLQARMNALRRQVEEMVEQKGEFVAMPQARAQTMHYMKGLKGAAALRRYCCTLTHLEDLDELIAAVFEEQRKAGLDPDDVREVPFP